MGMPSTKAECDSEIAYLKKRIENQKIVIANAKKSKKSGVNVDAVIGPANTEIFNCQRRIKQLQERKKSLK